ncbi:MAG: SCP2 domain-containing protein [Marinicella pacifica]
MDTNQQNPLKQGVPQLPGIMAAVLKNFPQRPQRLLIELALNRFFATDLRDNNLDFLADYTIAVIIKDAHINFALRLHNNRLQASSIPAHVDLTLSTDVYTLLEMISQKEDADGLFFSRRLDSQGNTELGLYVKNFLAALDPDESRYLEAGMKISRHLIHIINFKHSKLTKVISS